MARRARIRAVRAGTTGSGYRPRHSSPINGCGFDSGWPSFGFVSSQSALVLARVQRRMIAHGALHEQRPQELANEIAQKIRSSETSLHQQIEHLISRPVADDGSERFDPIRRKRLYGRAKRQIDAMAAMIGIKAWSQGAGVIRKRVMTRVHHRARSRPSRCWTASPANDWVESPWATISTP
jgi:hypothetical protein